MTCGRLLGFSQAKTTLELYGLCVYFYVLSLPVDCGVGVSIWDLTENVE